MIPQKIKNQSQDDEDESNCKWVQCPDMPEGLLTIDDETPHKMLKGKGTGTDESFGDWDGRGDE